MQEIRIAIIGHGFMGHEDEKMLLKMPGIRLVGFSDIDPKQLEDVAPGLKRYASNEELLADPEVDVVIIAANNNQHHKLVCQAARAGKDILCEKPVAMTVAELDDMIRVVNECGVKFTVHHQRGLTRTSAPSRKCSTIIRWATSTWSRPGCTASTAICTTGTSTNRKAAGCSTTGASTCWTRCSG